MTQHEGGLRERIAALLEKFAPEDPNPPARRKTNVEVIVTKERKALPQESVSHVVPIAKRDDERQMLWGVVMEPEETDTQGDIASAEEIAEAQIGFMLRDWQPIGKQHGHLLDRVKVVECGIQRADCYIGDEFVRKGSWVMGVHIGDKEVWESVKNGDITGFSIGGKAQATPLLEE